MTELYKHIHGDLKNTAAPLIAANCMSSLVDDAYVYKAGISDADLPEVSLSMVGLAGPTTSSSSHAKFSVNYEVLIVSGKLTQVSINQLCWWLLTRIAFMSFNTGIFIWKGEACLKKLSFLNGQIGLTRAEANRNVTGFSSLGTIVADAQIPYTLFLPPAGSNV